MRISNFLLWQISYAELWVTETLWPEFSQAHLAAAIRDYARRQRRFGGLSVAGKPPTMPEAAGEGERGAADAAEKIITHTGRRGARFELLRYRLLSASLLISAALMFVALDAWAPDGGCAGIWIAPLGAVLFFGSAWECCRSVARRWSCPYSLLPGWLGAGGVIVASMVPMLWAAVGRAVPERLSVGASRVALDGHARGSISHRVLVPALLCPRQRGAHTVLRRQLGFHLFWGVRWRLLLRVRSTGSDNYGLFLVIGTIVVVKAADAGAYFTGRWLGRHKLCPRVSPGKTREGLVGALVIAAVVGVLYFEHLGSYWFPWAGFTAWKAFGTGDLDRGGWHSRRFDGIDGQAGETGVKDSGHLLPGLGGFWDVTDSVIPALLVTYLAVLVELIPSGALH
ncbi:MAG: hypothetical protein KatS3mg111_1393 [Pirellulaceae bacterium]|nr:MAG: hypothetical protein KatS3mg111_1393 [Pirellulaceae bacterium]